MNAITKPSLAPPPPSDNSLPTIQRRDADRINAHLDRGGRVWFGLAEPREVERVVAVGGSLVFALADGTEEVCGHFGSMSGGYSLAFEAPGRDLSDELDRAELARDEAMCGERE